MSIKDILITGKSAKLPGDYAPKLVSPGNVPDGYVCEHRFDLTRKWRFDYAWPEHKIALEIEGGVWINGRHTRGTGFIKDMEKYNAAATQGWRVLRVTPQQFDSGEAGALVKKAIRET